jgi:hypothetical protein
MRMNTVFAAALLLAVPSLTYAQSSRSGAMPNQPGASEFAPGQQAKRTGMPAKKFAPGQQAKRTGRPARTFAPGQQDNTTSAGTTTRRR